MNILQVFHTGDFILIATFLLLILMSIFSWTTIINKTISLKKEQKSIEKFNEKYQTSQEIIKSLEDEHENSVQSLVKCVKRSKNMIQNLPHTEAKEILTMNLIQTLDKQKIILDSGLTILASIANSSPFIGLFGTVWGIYTALLEISSQGNAGLSIVAGPMGEALIATAVGLFVAIPSSLAYNTFARKNKLLVQNLRHISEKLTIYVTSKCQ